MSLEAQFYEARRRQHFLERRLSLRTAPVEIDKQKARKSEYQILSIPVRVFHHDDRSTCPPKHRIILAYSDHSIYQRNRDIYPRPLPLTANPRRHAKVYKRFSSIDYLQQW